MDIKVSKLVIVESPFKIKSIAKYLGKGYEVVASVGHLRDLPKSRLGVDIENNFEPHYIPIKGKEKIIKEIKAKVAKASSVILATDPDREGEAISWHLANLLNLDPNEKNRVTFNEITQKAVTAGINNMRAIDTNLVDAYQARRVLDRIMGYQLSPLLWKKIKKGLSAGRVQSVVTKLVVDRENEIRSFKPEEYWTIDLVVAPEAAPDKSFTAKYYGPVSAGKKQLPKNKAEADEVVSAVKNAAPVLSSLKFKTRTVNPAPPFITSTLQQEASKRLSFSSKKTMKLAQDLYEGMNIADLGVTGLITYMRTDSLRLSDDVVAEARAYISDKYGKEYVPDAPRVFKTKNSAQDAHEAIRPSHIDLPPEAAKASLPPDHYKLYKLIWDRFTACQMSAAVYDTVSADITSAGYLFKANGRTLKFPGFTVLYEEQTDPKPDSEEETALPPLSENEPLLYKSVVPEQKFTQPPPRYTEATLIRAMEEKNIGRPSTYAPTISTILEREYVEHEGKALKPTALGEIVTGLMVDKFSDFINVDFTADMEVQLDKVEEGNENWRDVISGFYGGFSRELKKAEEELAEVKLKVPDIVTDEICPNCGSNLIVKSGRFGKFLACPNYPECKFTKPLAKVTPGICPKCGGKVVELKTKKNKKYFACENRKNCGFMTWDVPLAEPCPKCGRPLFRRYTKDEKKIYCPFEGCGYEREYRPRGRAVQTDAGEPEDTE